MGSPLCPSINNAEQTMEAPWLTPPKNFRRVHSAGKVIASIFWDSQGVIMIDYLEQGRAINGVYYAGELRWLRKRRGKLTHAILLLQGYAPAHTAQVAMTAATEYGFEILPNPHILLIWLLLTSIGSQN